MKEIDNILEECDKKSLFNGQLNYEDTIGIQDLKDSKSHLVLKYYLGWVSSEEHKNFNEDLAIRQLYIKYILKETDFFETDFDIEPNDIESLIYLRMTLSSESEYIERLDKIMFRIYCEKQMQELTGLIQSIYEKYDWAKKYINNNKCAFPLIYNENSDEYKRNYGICEENSDSDSSVNAGINEVTRERTADDNWILSKFGG